MRGDRLDRALTGSGARQIRALVVDSESITAEAMAFALRSEGIAVTVAVDGATAVAVSRSTRFDVALLDVNLPDVSGLDVLRELREVQPGLPVVLVTTSDSIAERIAGVEAGATDYLVKPFPMEEVVFRVGSILRRAGLTASSAGSKIVVGDLVLDEARRQATRSGRRIPLTATEFRLLRLLMSNPEVVLSKAEILERIWGFNFESRSNLVGIYVSYLRRKIDGGRPPMIHTLRGIGYFLKPAPVESAVTLTPNDFEASMAPVDLPVEAGGQQQSKTRTAAVRTGEPEIGTEVPLSLIQESILRRAATWSHDQPFVSAAVLRIDGPVDPMLLRGALNAAVAVHPELASRLVQRVEGPVLMLREEVGDVVDVVDLSGRPRSERLLDAQRLVTELVRTPIDPSVDPMIRARLVSIDADSHRLAIAVHPLVADMLSLAMLFDGFVRAYRTLARLPGAAPEVPSSPPDVSVEAIRRRRAVGLESRDAAAAFWTRLLQCELEPLTLPRGAPVSEQSAIARLGEYAPCLIPPRLVRAARELADELGTTVFVVMIAALVLVMYRYGGHRRVPVTVPFDTRTLGEEHEFGAFTTLLPLIVEVDEATSLADLVAAVRDLYAQTSRHAAYPLSLLEDSLTAATAPPPPQLGARYLRHPRFEADFGDVRVEFDPRRTVRADVDLHLEIFDHDDTVTVGLIYRSGLFDGGTAARVAGHFRTALASGLADPRNPIGGLRILTESEERQIRFVWNRTATPFPDGATVHQLVEQAAATYPAATAVCAPDRNLSYAEFNAVANRLAHRLRELGAGPGTRICALLHHSIHMPIALLATLKAGAAYVPIDPGLPVQRMRHIIADTAAPVLLTVTALAPADLDGDVTILTLDGDAAFIEAASPENPPAWAGPDDIAYVSYAWESTGTPVAALIRHVGVVNLVRWFADEYALDADDRVLLKTCHSHEASIPEFFIPLTLNGTLLIAPPDAHHDPDKLVDLIERHGVTVAHFFPTWLGEFVGSPAVRNCTSLRHVFVSGDAVTRDLVERFSAALDAQLHLVYRPNETADYSTFWEIQPDPAPIAPIGRPIANMSAYIVDSARRLMPVGIPGELCVAGVGIGAGFLNRPDLTAERFVDNPFGDGEGLLYLTGDICMWRPDGTLEFIGRAER